MEQVFYILLIIGGAQGLLLAAALLTVHRGNRKANRILAVLLIFYSFLIIVHTGGHPHSGNQIQDNHEVMGHAIFFVIGPLSLFYSKALIQYDFKLKLKDMLHFIPCVFVALLIYFFGWNSFVAGSWSNFDLIIMILITVQMTFYLIFMFFILHKYMNTFKDTYSSLEKINLNWLRFFVISQIIVWTIAFIIDVSSREAKETGITWLPVSIFVFLTGYFGLRQPEIFSGEMLIDKSSIHNGRKKYEKSALTAEQAEAILHRLQAFMRESKPFIAPTLTLPALSKQMNVSPNHLSQVINERLNKNFFEFINSYRIEEAKLLLKDPAKQNLTLAAIGFEAGFNSVSSFNKIFKEITSCTPSQYRSPRNPL